MMPTPSAPTAVVALGGHAFIRDGETGTFAEQVRNANALCEQLMILVERGYRLVLTHGNGPQVGALLNAAELTRGQVPEMPLDVLVAQTEGSLGYLLQQGLLNALRRRGIRRYVVTVVTQVFVDPDDPAFDTPTKPVGPALDEAEARDRQARFGWDVTHDVGRGWRRVVPSPAPTRVLQRDMIREAAEVGHIVIAAGGGGIPIVTTENGDFRGVEAVIDKDQTSSILATDVGAELLIILTPVDCVYLHFGTPDQLPLGAVTIAECEHHVAAGHFPPGSMGPKVGAIHDFLKRGGRRGLITRPELLTQALEGAAGTHFVGRI